MPRSSAGEVLFLRDPHPLAGDLAAQFDELPASILELGTGSGRNAKAFAAINFSFTSISDNDVHHTLRALASADYDGVLSTHGLLHGTAPQISTAVKEIARILKPSGLLYATFGSQSDARFGAGNKIDGLTYAPVSGDEAGVPHVYYTREGLTRQLHDFALLSLEERSVDEVAGRWAHTMPLKNAVHWFVQAKLLRAD